MAGDPKSVTASDEAGAGEDRPPMGLARRLQPLGGQPVPTDDEDADGARTDSVAVVNGGWTRLAERHAQPTSAGLSWLRRHLPGTVTTVLAACFARLGHAEGRSRLWSDLTARLRQAVDAFRHPAMTAIAQTGGDDSRSTRETRSIDDTPPEPDDPAYVRAKVEALLRVLPAKGEDSVPTNLTALGRLLAETLPSDDFTAVDLLHDCFPRGTRNSHSRVLLAVARNLSRPFGHDGRLPMASAKAWTMLDPILFADELAYQMDAIVKFVLNWQSGRKDFLILEFAEVELIEYLFEHLHPRRHGGLLAKVMEFKVLSLRRMGLLRRLPSRIRHRVQKGFASDPDGAMTYVEDTLELLEHLAKPHNFSPVVEAARVAHQDVSKIAEHLAKARHLATCSPEEAGPVAATGGAIPSLDQIMRGLGPAGPAPLPGAAAGPVPPRPQAPPAVPQRRRFTRKQKTEAVLRVFHGEDREWVALSVGISPETLLRWQEAFLAGGAAALAPAKGEAAKTSRARGKGKALALPEPSIHDLKTQLASLIRTVEQLSTQIQAAPTAETKPLALPAPKSEN